MDKVVTGLAAETDSGGLDQLNDNGLDKES
jgi:hypothetical protein